MRDPYMHHKAFLIEQSTNRRGAEWMDAHRGQVGREVRALEAGGELLTDSQFDVAPSCMRLVHVPLAKESDATT